jgi:hypothetical protein
MEQYGLARLEFLKAEFYLTKFTNLKNHTGEQNRLKNRSKVTF